MKIYPIDLIVKYPRHPQRVNWYVISCREEVYLSESRLEPVFGDTIEFTESLDSWTVWMKPLWYDVGKNLDEYTYGTVNLFRRGINIPRPK